MKYDAVNRLICYNDEELKYDADGNMTTGVIKGEITSLKYDCRNRLTKAGGTTYKYNAENTRISTETAETTTEYVTDVSGSLSRVLAEYVTDKETGETVETIYVYGQGLISQENIFDEETSYGYYTYHYNHLGSTTAITDEEGKIVERYIYGTYGELLSGTTDKVNYLYNGQYGVSTEDNGLYYMRQRYYNPEIKRFINQDIITGSIGNSQSLNRYCYVQGNPVIMTDPFGLFPIINIGKDFVHAALNFLGMIPVIGVVADVVNAGLYLKEGDVAGAVSCGISALPGIGDAVAGGMLAVRGAKAAKTARYVKNVSNLIGNGVTFLRCTTEAISGAIDVVSNYIETGEMDWGGLGAVGLNSITAAMSGRAALSSGNALRKALSEDNVAGKIKNSLGNVAGKVKGGNLKKSSSYTDRLIVSDSLYLNSDGRVDWDRWAPNGGRVEGSVIEGLSLSEGTVIDRYGGDGGTYTSPVGTPYEQRALPYIENENAYHQYEVVKRIDGVTMSEISAAFNQVGGGIQFELPKSIKELIDEGYLKEIKN